ncbi:MAG: vitamin K epoxide reductase family protein [Gemmatimonadota bacterium]
MTDTDNAPLTPRHWIAVTALISGLVALYLHLWKLGLTGPLVCSANHGCEIAQMSPWGWFLGVDVALIGTIGYTLIFATAIVGIQPRWINDPRITRILVALIVPAILFTIRLKYAEFVILKTFCPWCAISAVTITTHGIAVLLDRRRLGTRLETRD